MSHTEPKSAYNAMSLLELVQVYNEQFELDNYSACSYGDIQETLNNQDRRPPRRLVFAWGAGKGKTTAQRQFIWMNYTDGIVYCAYRIEEIKEMARKVAAAVPADKILVLHSQAEAGILEQFHTDPHFLAQYDVLLITHEMLVKYPPDTFLEVNIDPAEGEVAELLGLEQAPHYSQKRGRKYLLIDEQPKYFDSTSIAPDTQVLLDRAMACQLDKEVMGPVTNMPRNAVIVESKPEFAGEFIHRQLSPFIGQKTTVITAQAASNIDRDLITASRLHELFAVQQITQTSIRRTAYKVNEAAKMLNTGPYYMKGDELMLYMGISELSFENICIFDATGDLLHRGSFYFKVIKDERWANRLEIERMESINFNMIPRNIEKHKKPGKDTIDWMRNHVLTKMEDLVKRHSKVMVVMWKNLQGETQEKDEFHPMVDNKKVPNDGLPDTLRQTIPLERQADVYITHYMSGQTRGTNEFRDAVAILFLGKFALPNWVIDEYNRVMKTNIDVIDWLTAEYVQAIYRTQARTGKPIFLYFSEDIDERLIASILAYTRCRQTDGTDIACQFNAELRLKQVLEPDPRNRAFPVLAIKAVELLNGEEVTFLLTDELLGDMRLGNFKQSVARLVGNDAIRHNKGRELRVRLPRNLLRAAA